MILVSEQRVSSKELNELDEAIEQAETLLSDIQGRETVTGAAALALALGGTFLGPAIGDAFNVQDVVSLLFTGAGTGLSVGMIFVILNAIRSGRAERVLNEFKELRAKAVEA